MNQPTSGCRRGTQSSANGFIGGTRTTPRRLCLSGFVVPRLPMEPGLRRSVSSDFGPGRIALGAQCAMTLTEVVISLALLGITVGAMIGLLGSTHARGIVTRDMTSISEVLRSQIEQALTVPYKRDANLFDGENLAIIPEILRLPPDVVDDPDIPGLKAPSTFVYDYDDETKRREYTPSFRAFDFEQVDENGLVVFNAVPIYAPADAGRPNSELNDKKQLLRAPQVSGTLRARTTLIDAEDEEDAREIVINNDGTTIENSGIRIFEVEVESDARGSQSNGLAPVRMVTFRAPSN